MKIKFLPKLLIELQRSENPPRVNINKEYRISGRVTRNDEELIQIKDDIKDPLWLPVSEVGVLFEYVEKEYKNEN